MLNIIRWGTWIDSYKDPDIFPESPEADAGRPSSEPNTPEPNRLCSLDLLIEDLREQPPNKFIQDLTVHPEVELPTGEWLVNTKAVLLALQNSPSSLNG